MGGSRKRRCAIFGGSFDPIHLGHIEMVRKVIEDLVLDEIILMPCLVSPFKSGTFASAAQRAEMIELAIEEANLAKASLSRFEIEREGPSYSWETAQHFAATDPETEWHWILGTDQWEAIETWSRPEILCELLCFIVLSRHGRSVQQRDGWRLRELVFDHPASSTAIRENFNDHGDWLLPSVKSFCIREGLYESAGEAPTEE